MILGETPARPHHLHHAGGMSALQVPCTGLNTGSVEGTDPPPPWSETCLPRASEISPKGIPAVTAGIPFPFFVVFFVISQL